MEQNCENIKLTEEGFCSINLSVSYKRRFFKVGGPIHKILVLRNKSVFKRMVMLRSSSGGTTRKPFLQVGQAFDWLNFKMANDIFVYSFDTAHQKLKSKQRDQGTENDIN